MVPMKVDVTGGFVIVPFLKMCFSVSAQNNTNGRQLVFCVFIIVVKRQQFRRNSLF